MIKRPLKMTIGDMDVGQEFRNKNRHYIMILGDQDFTEADCQCYCIETKEIVFFQYSQIGYLISLEIIVSNIYGPQ
jgi:hypothetical protein